MFNFIFGGLNTKFRPFAQSGPHADQIHNCCFLTHMLNCGKLYRNFKCMQYTFLESLMNTFFCWTAKSEKYSVWMRCCWHLWHPRLVWDVRGVKYVSQSVSFCCPPPSLSQATTNTLSPNGRLTSFSSATRKHILRGAMFGALATTSPTNPFGKMVK